MKVKIKCEDCAWYWFNEDYRRNMCSYSGRSQDAPCERETFEEYDDEEERW